MTTWRLSLILCLLFSLGLPVRAEVAPAFAAPDSGNLKVVLLPLSAEKVTYIPSNPKVTVFVQFPHPISDYAGRGFSEDPSEVAGDFFVRCLEGDSYFAVTPMTVSASRTLHVVCGGVGYPLHFFPAQEEVAWDKVIFVESRDAPGTPHSAARGGSSEVARSSRRPSSTLRTLSTTRALGIFDMLRLLANLPEKKATAMVATNPALAFSVKNKRQLFGTFAITTHFVLRDSVFDALGFATTIENLSSDQLEFVPGSMTVRVGEHVYAALAEDMSPIARPKSAVPAFFVVAGDGAGGANRLAPENDFRLSIDLKGQTNPRPVTTQSIPVVSREEERPSGK